MDDESSEMPLSLLKIDKAIEGVVTVAASLTASTKQTDKTAVFVLVSSLPKNHVFMVLLLP